MITTLQLLDELKLVMELPSDRAVAKYLDITQAAVSRWRTGHPMGEDMALKMAELLELDADLILLSNMAERRLHRQEQAKKSSPTAA